MVLATALSVWMLVASAAAQGGFRHRKKFHFTRRPIPTITEGSQPHTSVNPNVQSSWGQCGGSGYSGPTTCLIGQSCVSGNPWYSQCVSPTTASNQQSGSGVPDSPIETTSFVTVITITETAQPTAVTTYITYLTPSFTSTITVQAPGPTVQPTSQPTAQPTVIIIGSTTITLIPDNPGGNKRRAPVPAEPTAPPVKERRDEVEQQ